MAAMDRMQNGARPLLEDGESIRQIFPAASGLHPLLAIVAMVGGLFLTNTDLSIFFGLGLMAFGMVLVSQTRNLVVAVTDRAVVVMESGMLFAFRPKTVMARLPGETVMGPTTGFLWKRMLGLSEALGTSVRVHMRFVRSALGANGPQ